MARNPRRPKTVPVMGVPFDVKWDQDCDDARGDCDGTGREIRIGKHDGENVSEGSTLLHETLHAILFISGLDEILERREKGLEETVVRTLEAALYPILPLLVKAGKP